MKNDILFISCDGRTGACCYSCLKDGVSCAGGQGCCASYEKNSLLYKMRYDEEILFLNSVGGNNPICKLTVQAYGFTNKEAM